LAEKREGLADEVKAEAGETEFRVGQSLRLTWLAAQRLDATLMPMFKAEELGAGYRKGADGLLERQVVLPPPAGTRWVPIVPDGNATAHLTWKRWMFLQCHVGVLGAHRNTEKTLNIVSRQAWWSTMRRDLELWIQRCMTCRRFRRMAQKQESPEVVPVDAECWQEVMIDLEGPSNPPDKQGNKYSLTYICRVCRGLLTERSCKCNATEARRMFAVCVFRSGTLPLLLLSDRGPELKNALMSEYSALNSLEAYGTGLGRRSASGDPKGHGHAC
jgi:hypothetical protein